MRADSMMTGRLIGDEVWLIETGIDPIIDAIQLCDVINLISEYGIMQATCIYLCATLA